MEKHLNPLFKLTKHRNLNPTLWRRADALPSVARASGGEQPPASSPVSLSQGMSVAPAPLFRHRACINEMEWGPGLRRAGVVDSICECGALNEYAEAGSVRPDAVTSVERAWACAGVAIDFSWIDYPELYAEAVRPISGRKCQTLLRNCTNMSMMQFLVRIRAACAKISVHFWMAPTPCRARAIHERRAGRTMDDFNDLYYFASVVLYHGFSAAARTIGIEKTRLSRRIAELERRLGVRLLQRSTRNLTLTEAGEHFYARCLAAVERANTAYDSIAEFKKEASGTVRLACPPVLAQAYLAPILPDYMAAYPKVSVSIEATDREVNLIEERFDLVLRARPLGEDGASLVVKQLGSARQILVGAPGGCPKPDTPDALTRLPTIGKPGDSADGKVRWMLVGPESAAATIHHAPRLLSNDLRVQLEAAIRGIGIALLPEPIVSASIGSGLLERVLPEWTAAPHVIHLAYPSPRGMLPSVRSLIDYLSQHLPASIQQRSLWAGPPA